MTYLSGNICCLQQWFLELWFMSTGWLEFIKTERYEKCHKVNEKNLKKKKMFVLCIFKLTCGSWRHYKCMNKYTLYNKRHLNCSKLTYTLQSWRWKIKHYLMWNLTCFIFCQKDKEVVQPGNKRRSSRSGLTEYERKVTFSFGCKFSILHVR